MNRHDSYVFMTLFLNTEDATHSWSFQIKFLKYCALVE